MNSRFFRILIVVSILLVFTIGDSIVNTGDGFKPGMITYIVLTVGLHVLAFEAVLSRSKLMTRFLWSIVVMLSAASFVFFEEWTARLTITLFLIGYTALLLYYLRKELPRLINKQTKELD